MDFLPLPLRIPAAVITYSICSGTMLLFNKLAMHYGKLSVGDKDYRTSMGVVCLSLFPALLCTTYSPYSLICHGNSASICCDHCRCPTAWSGRTTRPFGMDESQGIALLFMSTISFHPESHFVDLAPLLAQTYSVYTVAFVLGVYCNMRALERSNVETVIIFRSCTPLAVSLCDWIFLGRELPSKRSLLALLTIAAGM